jgi:hypothetical protein
LAGRRAPELGRGAARPPESLAQGDDPGGRDGGLGRLHHAAQFGRGADDDVHHAALRCAAAGRRHVDLHELRVDDPVLRHRGAAGAAVRRRAVAGPARERAGPLPVRPVPGEPDHHRRHRRADGDRALLPEAGARPDPPVRGMGGPAKPAGGPAAGAAERGHRRRARERDRLQQSARLARALLGDAALGPVARQQAARRLRRPPCPRAPRQLRRHPPDPDPGDVPALLRADPGRLGHRRGAVGGGDELLRAAGAHADLHPHLAAHPHLLHAGVRILRLFELGAAGPEGRGARGAGGAGRVAG